jgi:hypothetical protein
MEEFVFRVNWPRQSRCIHGLVINRITTWAVVKVTVSTIMLTAAPQATIDSSAGTDMVRFELENNTAAERTEAFDAAKVVPLYDELIALAFENAKEGELQ